MRLLRWLFEPKLVRSTAHTPDDHVDISSRRIASRLEIHEARTLGDMQSTVVRRRDWDTCDLSDPLYGIKEVRRHLGNGRRGTPALNVEG